MTILEAWECYKKDKEMINYSKHTLRGYAIQARLLSEGFDDCDITTISREQLKEYIYGQREHLKPSSIGYRVRFIHSFFRWAVDEGYININPSAKIREPKLGKVIPKFLSEEDIETLRAYCSTPREHAIIEFMYTTGCRIGEIAKVDINDIDWVNNSLVVNGKGNVEREVYFNTKCRIWLKKYIELRTDDNPALFVTERSFEGKPRRISVSQMRVVVKGIAKRAGIEANVYPHRLRHSYATHLLNNGAPMEAIQRLLGHEKHSSTEIYAHSTGELRRQIYKRYFNT
jgi:integrase/recombinase XerD